MADRNSSTVTGKLWLTRRLQTLVWRGRSTNRRKEVLQLLGKRLASAHMWCMTINTNGTGVDETPKTTLPLGGVRVFVAEDEFLLALDLCDILACAGAEVLGPARSRAEAETYVAGHFEPDIALLDLNLNGESSAEIALHLASRDVPVILTTGYEVGDVPKALAAMPVCLKPISAASVLRTICTALGKDL